MENKSVIPGLVEGVVMSILLLCVVKGSRLFHCGEALAASCQFWD
jgi:hypothetical protein